MSAATDSDRKAAYQEIRDDRSRIIQRRRHQDRHWDCLGPARDARRKEKDK